MNTIYDFLNADTGYETKDNSVNGHVKLYAECKVHVWSFSCSAPTEEEAVRKYYDFLMALCRGVINEEIPISCVFDFVEGGFFINHTHFPTSFHEFHLCFGKLDDGEERMTVDEMLGRTQ